MFPNNQQMWDNIYNRVKASHGGRRSWKVNEQASAEYAREGGSWVDSKSQADPRFIDRQKEYKEKLKEKQKAKFKKQFRGRR